MYEIIDSQTGKRVGGVVKSLKAARRAVDRLDNAYGAYRYYRRKLAWTTPTAPIGTITRKLAENGS